MAGLAGFPRCAPNWTASTTHARPADAARAGGGAGGDVRQAPARSGPDARPRSSAACCAAIAATCRAQALVRIWRELLAGTTAMQGPFVGRGVRARRRRRLHPGRARAFRRADAAARASQPGAGDGRGERAAAPRSRCCRCPTETETPRDAWWTALLQQRRAAHPCGGAAAVLGAAAEGAPPCRRW